MSEEEEQPHLRTVPQTDLDFNLMTTDPVWGSKDINPELQKKLSETVEGIDAKGNIVYRKSELWGLLNFYTRDIRLGNLRSWDELPYVQYYLDLAGDLLQSDMIKAFLISLSRAATKIELSQSKNGFLRRRMNTFTKESSHTELDAPKKNLFGGKNGRNN